MIAGIAHLRGYDLDDPRVTQRDPRLHPRRGRPSTALVKRQEAPGAADGAGHRARPRPRARPDHLRRGRLRPDHQGRRQAARDHRRPAGAGRGRRGRHGRRRLRDLAGRPLRRPGAPAPGPAGSPVPGRRGQCPRSFSARSRTSPTSCRAGSGRRAASRVIASRASRATARTCLLRALSGSRHRVALGRADRPQVVDVADDLDAAALEPVDPELGLLLGPVEAPGRQPDGLRSRGWPARPGRAASQDQLVDRLLAQRRCGPGAWLSCRISSVSAIPSERLARSLSSGAHVGSRSKARQKRSHSASPRRRVRSAAGRSPRAPAPAAGARPRCSAPGAGPASGRSRAGPSRSA